MDQCRKVSGISIAENIEGTNKTIVGLESYSMYSVSVFEVSGDQLGDEDQVTVVTLETGTNRIVIKQR